MVKKKTIGQITIKKVGNKYAACISGDPQELFNTFKKAEELVEKLRSRYGRRHYEYSNHKKKKRGKKHGK